MTTALLELVDVGRRFETTGVSILSDINLTISEGEFVCMLGPSGSGKSTLLSILGCLDRPSQGRLVIRGQGDAPNFVDLCGGQRPDVTRLTANWHDWLIRGGGRFVCRTYRRGIAELLRGFRWDDSKSPQLIPA
jgi:energy-coupling factor transporter ATP-binding protein EcfA2